MQLVYCDKKHNIMETPEFLPAFRSGRNFVTVDEVDLIPIPYGSFIFSLPERHPVVLDHKKGNFKTVKRIAGAEAWASSAFVSSGYLRTFLPAYVNKEKAPTLSLWAYSGVVSIDGEFFVPAIRIDKDKRSDPEEHENDPLLEKKKDKIFDLFPENRLIRQLYMCSTEYRCLCARNFFLGRHEVPVPTSPVCNARCLGCLSHQEKTGVKSAQFRLDFSPTPEEIAEVFCHHFSKVKKPVGSFGQGCEGEPLVRGKDLAKAIKLIRKKTDVGTINLNTNGSLPENAKAMMDAGLDSIRISLNSVSKNYYNRYYKPKNYKYEDVLRTLDMALDKGLWVSLNLFFLPGFTDSQEEIESLWRFLERYPVDMIQTRNLNIDPDFYLDEIKFKDSPALGIRRMIHNLETDFPGLRLGYYNPHVGRRLR